MSVNVREGKDGAVGVSCITIDSALNGAIEELKREKRIMMKIIATSKDGMVFMPMRFGNEEEKQRAAKMARQVIQHTGLDSYFHISETWQTQVNMEKPDKPFVRAGLQKDRREAILVAEYRKDRLNKSIMQFFHKDDKGEIVFDEKIGPTDFTHHYSLFDFFIEEEAYKEHLKIADKEHEQAMKKALAKEFAERHRDKYVGRENTPELRAEMVKDMMVFTAEKEKEFASKLRENDGDD